MATARLTNSIRDAIKSKVMHRAFDKLHEDLKEREHDLAVAVYNIAFSKKDHKLMEMLPSGWLPKRSSFQVKFEEGTVGYITLRFKNEEDMVVPYNKHNYGALVVIELGHEIEKSVIKWQNDKSDLEKKQSETKASVVAILDSVTTIKRLMDVWPEAKDFILPYMSESKCTLPAIQFKEVNKMLNLPPKKA